LSIGAAGLQDRLGLDDEVVGVEGFAHEAIGTKPQNLLVDLLLGA